ncbi:MAG: amidohydrolase family protein [candidate division KSB1 bacterium]|nr:amidohydrolase family protein [candidate division KSB1 bacterium]MDZ7364375.1 amidohydrolase family protein [candidate division KSB1 bacterium]MDZ7402747.1 amidohydrolase family protein [candidate division KSB1 bacterium]
MQRRRFPALIIAVLFCFSSALYPDIFPADTMKATKQDSIKKSDASKKKEWDVTAAHGPTSDVEFTTTEGTWMNLDVSPDGKEIVFDLLGDIYIMPITGGAAKLLAGGPAFEVQPRFSPDGKKISYTSDRAGGDNIWVMNRDGSGAKAVTKEDFRLLNNASWTPDGKYLVARKHFTGTRSLGAGELWLYHASGGLEGLQLTKRRNDQQDAGEPSVSPDGRYVYFSEDMSPGPFFQYNKDPNGQIYVIRRYDRETGKLTNFVTGAGGAVRPQPSPDGKYIAFVRRVRLKSVLYLYDLQTGEELPIYDGLSKDQQETWAIFGVYPNYAWTPDSKNIVIWAKGKIWKIDIAAKKAAPIPFEAKVKQTITAALRYPQKASLDSVEVKMLRSAVTSPDGLWLVFNAAGHLWKKRLPNGAAQRLTNDSHFEFEPAFSPDGKWVVYTTWNDTALGAVYKTSLDGRLRPQKLVTRKGYYLGPKFSPDGQKIVYQRDNGNSVLGFAHGTETGLYWISANGGQPNLITEEGRDPRFNRKGDRIFYLTGGGMEKTYKSVRLDGGEPREHFKLKYVTDVVPSPNEEWVAFTELFNAYIAPFPQTGGVIELNANTKAIPVKKVSRDAGSYLHWSGDSKKLHWTIGPEYFTRELTRSFKFVEGAPDSIPPPDTIGLRINLKLKTDVPTGKLALVGARIITMRGDEVIENGTIVVDGNRIAAIGRANEVSIPTDAKRIEVQGKTIMPGLIDVHAHANHFFSGLMPQQHWPYFANLAYGVTTIHDPSANTETVFSLAEMVAAGKLVGPRVYSTGTILYGADGDFKAVINNLDDARSHLRRMKAVGAFSVKSYNQPRRNQRQQVIQAGRELQMMVVPEGGSTFYHNLSMILDGHTGIEHSIPVAPVYHDVLKLWGASQTGYTPTLIVGYGGIWGENYWYQKTNVWEKSRLLNFTPRPIIDSRARRRMMIPDDDFGHLGIAQAAKALLDAGAKVHLGAHGQLQGLGAHWEMWMLAQGGMTPLQAIRAATLHGAHYLGLDSDIGSLETGKLADLIVLNQNPLDNIQNSEHILYVMKNGRLYDAETMNEIGNHPRSRNTFFWENPRTSEAFVWKGAGIGFGEIQCSCQ